jgi:hypothetical protein
MVPSVQICPKEKRLIEKEEEQDKLETSIKSSTHGGSTWWMAPDLLLLNVFSPDLSFCSTIESDVWAFTCLLRGSLWLNKRGKLKVGYALTRILRWSRKRG